MLTLVVLNHNRSLLPIELSQQIGDTHISKAIGAHLGLELEVLLLVLEVSDAVAVFCP